MKTVYLDYNATTPLDPHVLEAMLPFLRENFGNAASRQHALGRMALSAVDQARSQLAEAIGADEREIIWTSGATESNNLAIFGVAQWYKNKGKHIITSRVEHKAVIDTCRSLEQQGYEITWLTPDDTGRIAADQVRQSLRDDTILVSIMLANNEVGTINPIKEIGAICREQNIVFHTDAAQAAGKMPINVERLSADLLTLSAHKVYGPKGVGALYVRRKRPRIRLTPLIYGGGHERGMRSGTLNVPGVVGMGEAMWLATRDLKNDCRKMHQLRELLWSGLLPSTSCVLGGPDQATDPIDSLVSIHQDNSSEPRALARADASIDHAHNQPSQPSVSSHSQEKITLNGHPTDRLPNTLNVSFAGIDAEQLIHALDHIAVSSGSACTTASMESSYVLAAMGFDDRRIRSAVRFSLGRFTTKEEIDYTVSRVAECVAHLRRSRPTALDQDACRPT